MTLINDNIALGRFIGEFTEGMADFDKPIADRGFILDSKNNVTHAVRSVPRDSLVSLLRENEKQTTSDNLRMADHVAAHAQEFTYGSDQYTAIPLKTPMPLATLLELNDEYAGHMSHTHGLGAAQTMQARGFDPNLHDFTYGSLDETHQSELYLALHQQATGLRLAQDEPPRTGREQLRKPRPTSRDDSSKDDQEPPAPIPFPGRT